MNTFMRYMQLFCMFFCLSILTAQPIGAAAATGAGTTTRGFGSIPVWVDKWIGYYDTSAMTDAEFESMVCITAAIAMGTLITVVGGTAIVIGGHVGRATSTAIALPVLVSSMWSSCAFSRAVLPGALWLQKRSSMLVKKLGHNNDSDSTNANTPSPVVINAYESRNLQFGKQ